MRRSWLLPIAAVVFALIACASVGAPRFFAATDASAGVGTPYSLSPDCDVATAGIQNVCFVSSGAPVDVDVVLTNNSGAPVHLGAFNFDAVTDNAPVLQAVVPGSCDLLGYDCNPDFNQSDVTGVYVCSFPPPNPDTNPSAIIGAAFLSCPVTGSGPTVADGASIRLATVHYITSDGVADLTLANVAIYDEFLNELMSCNPVIVGPGDCLGARVQVGSSASTSTPIPTSTFTPTPTSTPAPQQTPPGTPAGGVSDVISVQRSVCISAGSLAVGLQILDAALDCGALSVQNGTFSFQAFLHCLRGFDVNDDGHLDCLSGDYQYPPDSPYFPLNSEPILHMVPQDFAKIDLDADQVQNYSQAWIIALVSGDYPVLFETDLGTFLDAGAGEIGPTTLCYTPYGYPTGPGDPDCDADPSTPGDGAVAVALRIGPNEPRGPVHVTVTQGGHSVVKTLTIVGQPATITTDVIDGKDTIETGATAPTAHGDPPLDTACDFPGVQSALTGIASLKKTVLMTRLQDSDGTDIAGGLVTWDHPFVPVQNTGPLPQGGVVLRDTPTWDLGAAVIGFPQVVCGGGEPGDLVLHLTMNPALAVPEDPSYITTTTVRVVEPPTATATPTPTPVVPGCQWDAFPDGVVNSLDLVAIAAHLGPGSSPPYDPAFDINASGGINSIDLMLTAQQFGPCSLSDCIDFNLPSLCNRSPQAKPVADH